MRKSVHVKAHRRRVNGKTVRVTAHNRSVQSGLSVGAIAIWCALMLLGTWALLQILH